MVLLRAGASCPRAALGLEQSLVFDQHESQCVAKIVSDQCRSIYYSLTRTKYISFMYF